MIELLPLFPYPLFKIDTKPEFDDIRDDLIDFCYLEKENDSKGLKNSNVDAVVNIHESISNTTLKPKNINSL